MPLDLDALKADVTELLARFMHGHYYIVEGVTPREKPLPTIRTLETCVTLLDELTEARRTLQWQPIETAPKDGRDVLLTNGEYKRTGYWAKAINAWSIDAAVRLDQPTHYLIIPPAPPED